MGIFCLPRSVIPRCVRLPTLLVLILFLLVSLPFSSQAHEHADGICDVLCRRCGATITRTSYILSGSETPPDNGNSELVSHEEFDETGHRKLSRFRNRVGQTFDVALFRSAQVNSVAASRTVQDTFFPGYAWRIAECPVCGTFLGWSFDRPAQCQRQHQHVVGSDEAKNEHIKIVTTEQGVVVTDPEGILNVLFASQCLTKSLVFWTVEWCHKKAVKQYHISGATMKRDPEYSLGNFLDREGFSSIIESNLNMRVPGTIGIRKMIEYRFVNGQHCDETNAPRSTVVYVLCCTNYHHSLGPLNQAFIASLREPEICSYEMLICVPELCEVPGFAPPANPKERPTSNTENQISARVSDDLVCSSGIPPKNAPHWFFALDWSTLMTDRSPEMFWTRSLHPVIGTGQLVM